LFPHRHCPSPLKTSFCPPPNTTHTVGTLNTAAATCSLQARDDSDVRSRLWLNSLETSTSHMLCAPAYACPILHSAWPDILAWEHLRAPAEADLPRLVAAHVGDAVLLEELVVVLDRHAHLRTAFPAMS
jgi:hypothetical protein